MARGKPSFQTSNLQSCETMHFCCYKLSSLWYIFTTALRNLYTIVENIWDIGPKTQPDMTLFKCILERQWFFRFPAIRTNDCRRLVFKSWYNGNAHQKSKDMLKQTWHHIISFHFFCLFVLGSISSLLMWHKSI